MSTALTTHSFTRPTALVAALSAATLSAQTFQTVTLRPTQDAYTSATSATRNFGRDRNLIVSLGRSSWLRFPTYAIPRGSRVAAASLRVRGRNVYAKMRRQAASLHRIESSWSESTITHALRPRSGSSLGPVELSRTDRDLVYTRGVSTLRSTIEAWVANPASNHGLEIRHTGGGSFDYISSREGSRAPELIVTYYKPVLKPDLQVQLHNPHRATIGSKVLLTGTVRNGWFKGTTLPAPQSEIHFHLEATPGPRILLGAWIVPALASAQSASFRVELPVPMGLCGFRNVSIRATVDPKKRISEGNETNNESVASRVAFAWPSAPGYYVGTTGTTISSRTRTSRLGFCSKKVGQLPPNTWYFFFFSVSGSAPGLSLPVGHLHLNIDPFTPWFTTRFDTDMEHMFGVQVDSNLGNTGALKGGAWLSPLRNATLHATAAYFEPRSGLIGVAKNAVRFKVD